MPLHTINAKPCCRHPAGKTDFTRSRARQSVAPSSILHPPSSLPVSRPSSLASRPSAFIPYQDYQPQSHWRCAGLPVIFSIEDDARLLPHFIRHYTTEGCTEFLACLWSDMNIPQVRAHLRAVAHRIIPVPGRFATGRSDSDFQDQVRRAHVAPDQWYVIADMDEFHRVPGFTLAEAVKRAAAAGAVAIAGEFVDRVTLDGSLPQELAADVWRQFPLETEMTKRLLTGCTRKVLAARGDQAVNAGHHDHDGEAWAHRGRVHHFKWWGNVVERQLRRLQNTEVMAVDLIQERRALVDQVTANSGRLPLAFPRAGKVPDHWRPRSFHEHSSG